MFLVKVRTLNVKHVLQLIEACKENGVTELRFRDFVLRFSAQTNDENPAPTANKPEEIPEANQQATSSAYSETREKLEAEQEVTSMMLLDDPLEMENRIAKGELVDAPENL